MRCLHGKMLQGFAGAWRRSMAGMGAAVKAQARTVCPPGVLAGGCELRRSTRAMWRGRERSAFSALLGLN